jgi:hypothetical protein
MMKANVELKELIRKTALINAAQHDGKAQAGAILGKILGEKAELTAFRCKSRSRLLRKTGRKSSKKKKPRKNGYPPCPTLPSTSRW